MTPTPTPTPLTAPAGGLDLLCLLGAALHGPPDPTPPPAPEAGGQESRAESPELNGPALGSGLSALDSPLAEARREAKEYREECHQLLDLNRELLDKVQEAEAAAARESRLLDRYRRSLAALEGGRALPSDAVGQAIVLRDRLAAAELSRATTQQTVDSLHQVVQGAWQALQQAGIGQTEQGSESLAECIGQLAADRGAWRDLVTASEMIAAGQEPGGLVSAQLRSRIVPLFAWALAAEVQDRKVQHFASYGLEVEGVGEVEVTCRILGEGKKSPAQVIEEKRAQIEQLTQENTGLQGKLGRLGVHLAHAGNLIRAADAAVAAGEDLTTFRRDHARLVTAAAALTRDLIAARAGKP